MTLRATLALLSLFLLAGCSDDKPSATASRPTSAPASVDPTAAPAPPNATRSSAAADATASNKPAASKMAPTPAVTTRETELKEKPFIDAKTLKRLPANTSVVIADRNGGWLRVTTGGQDGWVRLLHISSQPTARAGSAQELESAAKIATGRAGAGNIVTTTGIRGLSEADLREATPNPEEFKKLERYGASKEQAAAYANKHDLERRQIAHLPEPR